ncbi:MAG: hypothetical protein R3E97_24255 [Candidatus Eisenbacteria bacterium]
MEGIAPSGRTVLIVLAAALLAWLAPGGAASGSATASVSASATAASATASGAATAASVSPLPLAAYSVRWTELEVAADSLHLDEIAANEAGRDSLRAALASELALWVESGARGWDELPDHAAAWVRARVREGFVLADPKWERFARSAAGPNTEAGLLSRIDPDGDWTLPGALFLLSHHAESADRWIERSVWPMEDRPFLAVLSAEARAAGETYRVRPRWPDSLLAVGGWPSWTEEPLEETGIEAAMAQEGLRRRRATIEVLRIAVAKGPGSMGRDLARKAGRTAEADSLAWKIARSYPGSARPLWLEEKVPLDQSLSGLTPGRDRVLLEVASRDPRHLTIHATLREHVRRSRPRRPGEMWHGPKSVSTSARPNSRTGRGARGSLRCAPVPPDRAGLRPGSRGGGSFSAAPIGTPANRTRWPSGSTRRPRTDRSPIGTTPSGSGTELESLRRFADAEGVRADGEAGSRRQGRGVQIRIGFVQLPAAVSRRGDRVRGRRVEFHRVARWRRPSSGATAADSRWATKRDQAALQRVPRS